MKRVFVLGSHPGLSVAEILSVLQLEEWAVYLATPEILVVDDGGADKGADWLMGRLGGTIRLGQLLEIEPEPEQIAEYIQGLGHARPRFGLSLYALGDAPGKNQRHQLQRQLIRTGMETKRHLKEAGVPSRFVRPQEGLSLSSVAIAKNRLLADGADLLILGGPDRSYLAAIEAIQPFEEFAQTDYGRPARDTKQGMLPPKLARLMLNLADFAPDRLVWDPFCGSGTVLTEAVRMGLRRGYASDLNPQAIADTQQNLAWIKERYPDVAGANVTVTAGDARQPLGEINENSLDAIVSELYLGEPRTGRESRGELVTRINEITLLIEQSVGAWRHVLKSGGRLTLALPAYIYEKERLLTEPQLPKGFRWQPLLSAELAERLGAPLTERGGLLYGRPNQLVWREIVRVIKE